MRERVWGGLILLTTSLSMALNIYNLLKEDELLKKTVEIPAKPVSYIEEKTEKPEDIKKFIVNEVKEIKNIKVGRVNPFLPLVKEEQEKPQKVFSFMPTRINITEERIQEKKPSLILRGILEGNSKAIAILETEDGERSFVVEVGQKVEDYKVERIDGTHRRITLRDSKGRLYNIKM